MTEGRRQTGPPAGRVRSPGLRALIAIRTVVGLTLLLRPDAALSGVAGRKLEKRERVVAQVLGARHLLEAAAAQRFPSVTVIRAGAAVDAIHAATALPFLPRAHSRRLAQLNLLSACGFAAAGVASARSQAGGQAKAAGQPQAGAHNGKHAAR